MDETPEDAHLRGENDDVSDVECNYCKQLFKSTHDEAVAEAEARGLDVL